MSFGGGGGPSLLLSSGANGSPWWIAAIEAFIVINLVLVTFAYLTLAERKVMGRMQLRYGPNRAGPYGLLQPIADLVKLIRRRASSRRQRSTCSISSRRSWQRSPRSARSP